MTEGNYLPLAVELRSRLSFLNFSQLSPLINGRFNSNIFHFGLEKGDLVSSNLFVFLPNGDVPERIFAVNCYPPHVVRINSYSRPRYLIDILHILAGLPELDMLLASPLGALFSLPVRLCSLSGQLVHQLLCRQLYTPNCEEIWFVYGSQPMRFSLIEFEELTGLSCAPFPPPADLVRLTTHADGCAPYWYTLIGRDIGSTTVEDLLTLLKTEPNMPVWRKFRVALVVIVEGILLCRTQPVKPSLEVVEMVKDIHFFLHYPWGRHSFKRLLRMVTIGEYIPDKTCLIKKLKQSSLAVHGFALPIQLLAFRSIPALLKFLPKSEDRSTFLDQTITYLPKCKSYHTSNILSTEHDLSLQVLFPWSACTQFRSTPGGDPKRELLQSLVSSGYKFTPEFTFGGDSSLPCLTVLQNRKKRYLDLGSSSSEVDSTRQRRKPCKTSHLFQFGQDVEGIVTIKLTASKESLLADLGELRLKSPAKDIEGCRKGNCCRTPCDCASLDGHNVSQTAETSDAFPAKSLCFASCTPHVNGEKRFLLVDPPHAPFIHQSCIDGLQSQPSPPVIRPPSEAPLHVSSQLKPNDSRCLAIVPLLPLTHSSTRISHNPHKPRLSMSGKLISS